jgi:hypothetical protein
VSIDDNPYTTGSEQFAGWRKWWNNGQASRAHELGPNATVASAAREKPGRKAAAASANGTGGKAGTGKAKQATLAIAGPAPGAKRRGTAAGIWQAG